MLEALNALSLPFMRMALAAGLLVGCACAYLGLFLILKRIVFVGAALAQIAAAGLAIGFALEGWWGASGEGPLQLPRLISGLATLVGALLFWLPVAERRFSRESLIGYAYAAATAVAVLVVAKNPGGELHDLDLLSGNLLFVGAGDLAIIAAVTAAVSLLHVALRKEFLFVSLDLEMATAAGLPGRLYDFLIYLSIGSMIAVAMRLVGVLFVFGSLVIPALSGLVVGRRLGQAAAYALLAAALGVTGGLLASYWLDLPTGATVVLAYAVLFLGASLTRSFMR
jgi:ABC-type Mn2+/Zn2+ transport system permease subunit